VREDSQRNHAHYNDNTYLSRPSCMLHTRSNQRQSRRRAQRWPEEEDVPGTVGVAQRSCYRWKGMLTDDATSLGPVLHYRQVNVPPPVPDEKPAMGELQVGLFHARVAKQVFCH